MTVVNLPSELGSKKFRASLYASLLAMLGVYLEFDLKVILVCIGPLMAYVPSEALADLGKRKAAIEAEAAVKAAEIHAGAAPPEGGAS